MHLRFILREMAHSRGQVGIYICCVALSLISLVALNSFRRDIHHSLLDDARNLHGGDIIVRSAYPFSKTLETTLDEFFAQEGITGCRSWEFYSVVRTDDGTRSILSNIKAVEAAYPLYGKVTLQSGQVLADRLAPGKAVVAANLLERLSLRPGDSILLGGVSLEIVDIVIGESKRPVDFFEFGPRVVVSSDDLQRIGLVQQGSRVQYEALIRLADEEMLDGVVSSLKKRVVDGQERITTYADTESRVKRFFDNLLFFLSLIAVFTLLLAGIGMQSGLSALFRRKEKSIAILKSFGATESFIISNYIIMTLLLSFIGCVIGVACGGVVKLSFPALFSGLIPAQLTFKFTLVDFLEGITLGLFVALFFAFMPISTLVQIRPTSIFKHENYSRFHVSKNYMVFVCGILLFLGVIVRQLEDLKIGLYFLGGFVTLVSCVWFLAWLQLYCLGRYTKASHGLRLAIRSLFRPGNSTQSITVTLASALAVLLTIELVQSNLHQTYIHSYPEGAPTLFCLDIQKNQKDGFRDLLGLEVDFFPVTRARLTAINDKKIDRSQEEKRRGDRLSREFNLTYRDDLLEDEILQDGNQLFNKTAAVDTIGVTQVSVLDTVADIGGIVRGDILLFNIQGVEIRAEVSSIRSRTKSMLYPFFYFVFPPGPLDRAPQTFFAALRIDKKDIASVENIIVNQFPNISTINVGETAVELGRIMVKLSRIIDFFALFSILAGGLILISSVIATKLARIQEGAYYKIMGAKSRFVLKVFFYEILLLALISGVCAISVAQVASWGISHFLLEIPHDIHWRASLLVFVFATVCMVGSGLVTAVGMIKEKPMQLLRE